MMRFRGGGVGHKSTRQATDFFMKDRDPIDSTCPSSSNSDSEEEMEETVAVEDFEEDILSEEEYLNSESELDFDDESQASEGSDEGDFGPEDDGGAIDEFTVGLGYSEL